MSVSVSWTKSWSNTDNGTILYGADLGNLQANIVTAFATAVSTSGNNTYTGSNTFNGAVVFGGAVSGITPTVVTVTDQASPVFDAAAGSLFTLSMGADRTLATPTNYPSSGSKQIILQVYASGAARTLTLPTASTGDFCFGSDVTAITQTADGKYDLIGCIWNNTKGRWMVVSYVKGY